MPSDANGVYSLPAGYLATSGEKIKPSQHNPVFQDLATSMTDRVLKNGNTPMTGPLRAYPGSVATPGMTFDGSERFGFFKTGSGIGVTIDGAQVAEFTAGGILKSARYIGELFPWTRITAPLLCVLPAGQTLSRAAYPDLWTVAQAEIAAGNTFYNNGDGVSTFGIGDLRGRSLAGKDNMGGSAANRLTATYFGTSASVLGAAGGNESQVLSLLQLPGGINSSGNNSISVTSADNLVKNAALGVNPGAASGTAVWNGGTTGVETSTNPAQAIAVAANNTGAAGNGSGVAAAHPSVPPTFITNFALFAGV